MKGAGWIVVKRRKGEAVAIGDIEIRIASVRPGEVALAIHAPGIAVRRLNRGAPRQRAQPPPPPPPCPTCYGLGIIGQPIFPERCPDCGGDKPPPR